ncbi:hypothetical protein NQZ68_002273 [Dissostichus eleginoides]|nr:hypothetical protein NQZ68_002273 [Dissostichus eleginoides]
MRDGEMWGASACGHGSFTFAMASQLFEISQSHASLSDNGPGCGTKPRPNNAGAAEGCDLETASGCDNSWPSDGEETVSVSPRRNA